MSEYADIFSNTWALILVLLFFGGSIFVHEFGHFLAARARKLKVTRFSIGFGPRLFSRFGKDGCEYIISALPFGGYVAIPQLADLGKLEGGDADEDEYEKLPKASCTDKIIVSSAGAFFNILFAAVLACIVWAVGVRQSAALDTSTIGYVAEKLIDVNGTEIDSPALAAGLKAGDKIISVDSRKVKNFGEIIEQIAIGSGRTSDGRPMANLEVERGGKKISVQIFPTLVKTNVATGDEIRMIGVSPATEMTVASVLKNSPAERAGVKAGDKVVSLNGEKMFSNAQLASKLNAADDGEKIDLSVLRDGKNLSLEIFPKKIKLTKNLAEIFSEEPGGNVRFLTSNPNPDANTGILKVFSATKDAPPFSEFLMGDILYRVNDKPVDSIEALNTIVNGSPKASRLKFSVMSAGSRIADIYMPAALKSKIIAGKTQTMLGYMLENPSVVRRPSIAEQFSESITRTYDALSSLVNPKSDVGISSLAGPVDIGRLIYRLSMTDFILVISFAVLLNVNLAFLNMLPIPVLDGGHILFAVVEKLRGRALPPAFFAAVQGAFSVLLISMMVYIVYYGFMRWSGDNRQEAESALTSEYYIKNISFEKL